jgi:hypothetical protein
MAKFDLNAAISAAVLEEKVRIREILTSPQAKGREQLALTLALDSNMIAEQVLIVLAAAPKANTGADRFFEALAKEGDLGVEGAATSTADRGDPRLKRQAELKAAADFVSETKYGVRKRAPAAAAR